ncbi:hypothetical protein GCK32_006571 [Trichostrongylus colubriformis]|uniref:Ferritin n=1 Tax=Trichostrongylus colubriformis TaxID=6319 RepID=A0AAN8GDS4_TRICO
MHRAYSSKVEAKINRQISRELNVSQYYLFVSMHFDRPDVNVPHFARWFRMLSDEKRERACKLMQFQNIYGARIRLTRTRSLHSFITKIGRQSALEIFQIASDMEEFEDIVFGVLRESLEGTRCILHHFNFEFSSTKKKELIDEINKIIANLKESIQG